MPKIEENERMCFLMARGGVSFEGIGARQTTYNAGDAIKALVKANDRDYVANMALAISGAATADFGADGDPLLGFVDVYEYDGHIGVQDRGYRVGVPISNATVGQLAVVNGSGKVKGVENAANVGHPIIVEVDSSAKTATVFLG